MSATRRVEELPFPYTLPDTTTGFEMIRVVEDMDDDCKIHVELADVMDHPCGWGWYLSEVARVIARDNSDKFGENALAEIVHGFMNSFSDFAIPVPADRLDEVKAALAAAGILELLPNKTFAM